MSGIVLQRGIMSPGLEYGGTVAGNEKKVCTLLAGETLLLRQRYAEAYIDATSAPTPIVWEGPYVRLRPAAHLMQSRQGDAGYQSAIANTIARSTGGFVNPVDMGADGDFFFEFDAHSPAPINAPFDCDVTLYTGLSGIWVYDYFRFNKPECQIPNNSRLYPQSRYVYGNGAPATRTITVPIGCVEISMLAYNDTNSVPSGHTENNVKTVGAGTSNINTIFSGNSPVLGPVGRMSVGGMTRVLLRTALANGTANGITFWISL